MAYTTVETWVSVDVDLDEFTDDDLIEELDRRGLGAESHESTASELIWKIYNHRRTGKDFQAELDRLIYQVTGRIV